MSSLGIREEDFVPKIPRKDDEMLPTSLEYLPGVSVGQVTIFGVRKTSGSGDATCRDEIR